MDEFSYLPVLISVIVGVRRYANFEGVPRNFAIAYAGFHLGASDRLGDLAAAGWHPELVGIFQLRHYQPWTFAAFAIVLLQTIVTYMLARIDLTRFLREGIVHLRESFQAHRVWFFAFGCFVILVRKRSDQ